MQLQKLFTLSGVALLTNVVGIVADVGPSGIPQQCKQICQPVVQRSQHCDATTNEDRAEKQCMCDLDNAAMIVPNCEACVAQFHGQVSDDNDSPHDNDVNDIIQFCNFSPTSFTGGAGGGGGGVVAPATSSVNVIPTSRMTSARQTSAHATQTSSRPHTTASQSPTAPVAPIFTGGAGVVNAGRSTLEALGVVFVAAVLA